MIEKLFSHLDKPYAESYQSPYSVRVLQRQSKKEKELLETFKDESWGMTLSEAMSSADVVALDLVPKLFVDEIVLLGQREAIARNNFGVVPQAEGNAFKVRLRTKDTGAQIIRELDEVKHDESDITSIEFEHNKIASAPIWSFERLSDHGSTLNDINDETILSASQIFRRENQLMWSKLTEFSSGENADIWDNYIPLASGSPATDNIFEALEEAYLSITNRVIDRFDPSSLTFFFSPTVYAELYKNDTFRRFDILGSLPTVVTGQLPNNSVFNVPYRVIEPGYWNKDSDYVHQDLDIYLVATQFAASIRERVALRFDPWLLQKNPSSIRTNVGAFDPICTQSSWHKTNRSFADCDEHHRQ